MPDRAETNVMVENTRRLLRELREAMDRADREEPGTRAKVYLDGMFVVGREWAEG